MAYNDWEAFWLKRGPLKFNDMMPFLHNFSVLYELITKHFGVNLTGLKSLEVGAGRGTMSHYLTNFHVEAHTLDKVNKVLYRRMLHNFHSGSVFNMPFHSEMFDIAFTYGLLEHFTPSEQIQAVSDMLDVTKPGGLNIHYIVPMKFTNILEDRNVIRDPCYWIKQEFNLTWVYPTCSLGSWRTNKWLGKGAFFTLEKKDEVPCIGNCESKQSESTGKE